MVGNTSVVSGEEGVGGVNVINKNKLAEEMGREIQTIRKQLLEFIVDHEYQSITTKNEIKYLEEALDKIDKYRSVAEDRCFAKGYIDSTDVFYRLYK